MHAYVLRYFYSRESIYKISYLISYSYKFARKAIACHPLPPLFACKVHNVMEKSTNMFFSQFLYISLFWNRSY